MNHSKFVCKIIKNLSKLFFFLSFVRNSSSSCGYTSQVAPMYWVVYSCLPQLQNIIVAGSAQTKGKRVKCYFGLS